MLLWRGAVALAAAVVTFKEPDLSWLIGIHPMVLNMILIGVLLVLGLAVRQRSDQPIENKETLRGMRKRTVAATVMILLAMPLTLYIGIYYFGDRKYYFIFLLIILETMLPFFLIFEGCEPQTRELIIIAVLCAIGFASRAAFFMLPKFKPVAAMVIIAGAAFGGEVGFLVGAVTMMVSNIMFGQGPWTPWQMFAMGIIGFLAGVLFRKGLLLRNRLPLCIFGHFEVILVYGGLMNPSTVLTFYENPTWPMFLTAYIMGFPRPCGRNRDFSLVHFPPYAGKARPHQGQIRTGAMRQRII